MKEKRPMLRFLLLSCCSGALELGAVYLGIKQEFPLCWILLFPFFYQIGNMMMSIPYYKEVLGQVCMTAMILLMAIGFWRFSYIGLAFQILCCSYCIQLEREKYKSECPQEWKRTARIVGFCIAPFFVFYNGQIVILLSILPCIGMLVSSVRTNKPDSSQRRPVFCRRHIFQRENGKRKKPVLSAVMIFHQLHYFIYAYSMLLYFCQKTEGVMFSALFFALTWLVYILPQIITEKVKRRMEINYKKIFFGCHCFLLLCMIGIASAIYFQKPAAALLVWLLTGIGGGSVFCIAHLSSRESIDMGLSENVGHVFGPLVAAILCAIFDGTAIFVILPALSAAFVLLALVMAWHTVNQDNVYAIQHLNEEENT